VIIGVLGYTDKRPVLYSLLKILQTTGDVVIITDDRHFKRLLKDNASLGHLLNILICITDAAPDKVWAEIGHEQDDFDHVIYDVRTTLPDEVDLYIHVNGSSLDEGEEDLLKSIEGYKKVKIVYDGKPAIDKDTMNIPVSSNTIANVELIENKKILNPFKDKKLNKVIASLVAKPLGLTNKDAIVLLNRGWKRP
jgi:hypothetical protein